MVSLSRYESPTAKAVVSSNTSLREDSPSARKNIHPHLKVWFSVLYYKVLFFLIFLFCFAFFLRIYNLPNLYIFTFDEEYQATYAMTLVDDPHPIWIGVSASFLDYYMGPYFTYFTAFLLWISNGDPLFTGYIAALLGAATSIAVFLIGWRFFNFATAVLASLLYAGLPLLVFYDQKYWNPMFVQLIVLLMFTSLMLIKKSPWWWLLFAAAIGAIFETDLVPLPLAIIGVYLFIKGKYFLNKKLLLACVGVFLLFYWPLLVFDYFHNFSNLTILSRYSEQARQFGARFDPSSKLSSTLDTMGRFWYLEPGGSNADEINPACFSLSAKDEFKSVIDKYSERTLPPLWLSLFSLVLFIYFLAVSLRSKNRAYQMLGYFLLISVVFYLFYTGGSFEYYLHGFVTLFTLVPSILISRLKKTYRPFFFVLIFFVLILGVNTIVNASDKFSLGPKRILIGKVMEEIGDNSFSIDGMGICHNFEGFRYLFKVYGKTPAKSYTDENFGWLYPNELYEGEVVYNVILSEGRVPPNKDVSGYKRIDVGGYSAYIKGPL